MTETGRRQTPRAVRGQQCRQRIVEAADTLFYQRGYNQSSFSEVAEAAAVPRGNFYYYFKSKDALLGAVIDYRIEGIRSMLDEWEHTISTPLDRLKRYVHILLNAEGDILRYGCPMGSLNVELSKTQQVQQSRARDMFEVFRDFITRQFRTLAPTRIDAARADEYALHLLAVSQGVSLITNVYIDPGFLRQEVQRLCDWLDSL